MSSLVSAKVTTVPKSKSLSAPITLMDDTIDLLVTIFGSEEVVNQFKQYHFRKSPLVVHGSSTRVSEICENLYDLDVQTYLENSASEQIHVWLAPKTTADAAGPAIESITLDDARQAYLLYQVGHSLYCRAPTEMESNVIPRALRGLGIGIAGSPGDRFKRGEIETFFSKQGHTTDFHIDFQDNITIQLSGTKRWVFRSSESKHPIRGCTPHYNGKTVGKEIAEQQLRTHRLCHSRFQANDYSSTGIFQQGNTSSSNHKSSTGTATTTATGTASHSSTNVPRNKKMKTSSSAVSGDHVDGTIK